MRMEATMATRAVTMLTMTRMKLSRSRCDQGSTNEVDRRSMPSETSMTDQLDGKTCTEDYDVYVRNPRVTDLRRLVRLWEEGIEVWPWVWTWRNAHGPHHVYIGVTSDCAAEIERLAERNASGFPNNVTIVASNDELKRLQPMEKWSNWQCGVIDGKVALLDVEAKILMLEDERIICFDRLVIAHRAEAF